MEIFVAVLVFLTGACLGVLVGLFTLVQRAIDRCQSNSSNLSGVFRETLDALTEIAVHCRRHVRAAQAGDSPSAPHAREAVHDESTGAGLPSSHRGERAEHGPEGDPSHRAPGVAGRAAGGPAGRGGTWQ